MARATAHTARHAAEARCRPRHRAEVEQRDVRAAAARSEPTIHEKPRGSYLSRCVEGTSGGKRSAQRWSSPVVDPVGVPVQQVGHHRHLTVAPSAYYAGHLFATWKRGHRHAVPTPRARIGADVATLLRLHRAPHGDAAVHSVDREHEEIVKERPKVAVQSAAIHEEPEPRLQLADDERPSKESAFDLDVTNENLCHLALLMVDSEW